MSGRLDQSLDSIIDGQKKAKRELQRRRKPVKTRAAPVGGVKKSTKPVKPAVKTGSAAGAHPQASKIVVSGLPFDVNEAQIKEYFGKSVGSVKKVSLQYNQNGQSRGIADILFSKPGAAAKAAKDLNGMLVDKRPMKIEVVVDASSVPEPAPAKSLAERVAYAKLQRSDKSAPLTKISANPKAQPKSATSTKASTKDAGKKGKAGKARPRRNKPKPKTAEELDAEMTDYWGNTINTSAVANATGTHTERQDNAAVAGGEELAMDEIS